MDYFAIGNDELAKCPPEEPFFRCAKCKAKHAIEHSSSKGENPLTLGFYKCGESSYLYSINGKAVL